ncbi:MAG: hypothetical protein Q7T03_08360 [Deltaproteobacteria bacterium]|nr:hypothetical protein [Deltaproteobacteria bacterium]
MPKPVQRTLLLSGGGNSTSNHYSQYLQAKRVEKFLSKEPGVALTTFFGSGLTPKSPASVPPDVSRDDGGGAIHFIRGEIPGNHAATYQNVQDYFKSKMAGNSWNLGDQFFLFVADHGMPNSWDPTDIEVGDENKEVPAYDNNCINLWMEEPSLYPEQQCLSVSTLKDWVQTAIPKNVPVHFVMSQCYSGGFHLLGYDKDEKGFPHAEENICGFTAITDDTTAAGCTSFVNEDVYDGYERRMAEAMTGLSILTGESIGTPILRLSEAHDKAIFLDNTKDVPLRTSESYLLDYWKAFARQESGKESAKNSDVVLDKQWKKLIDDRQKVLNTMSPSLRKDMERRLQLIDTLQKQVVKWNSEQKFLLDDADLASIRQARKGIEGSISKLGEESALLSEERREKSKPINTKYILSLKNPKTEGDRERLEFLTLFEMDHDVVIARLKKEDPSLKKLERFLKTEDDWKKNTLAWAEEDEKRAKPSEIQAIRDLLGRRQSVNVQKSRLETVEGQLRRIEVQMQAAAVVAWLVENKSDPVLAEVASLVKCETEADTF